MCSFLYHRRHALEDLRSFRSMHSILFAHTTYTSFTDITWMKTTIQEESSSFSSHLPLFFLPFSHIPPHFPKSYCTNCRKNFIRISDHTVRKSIWISMHFISAQVSSFLSLLFLYYSLSSARVKAFSPSFVLDSRSRILTHRPALTESLPLYCQSRLSIQLSNCPSFQSLLSL